VVFGPTGASRMAAASSCYQGLHPAHDEHDQDDEQDQEDQTTTDIHDASLDAVLPWLCAPMR
jgi:hypothetical protein